MHSPRTIAIAACWLACTTSRSADDAGATPDAAATPGVATTEAAAPDRVHPIVGEWERRTEPYKGMRIAFRDSTPMRAVVTTSPPVTPERIGAQRSTPPVLARSQLECQRSLWKPGDELVTGARSVGMNTFEATILVRDWGFTGTCRHADSHAPARLIVSPDGALTIEVTRGATVKQQWARVSP